MRREGQSADAEKVMKATTHWLRHTRGSHSAETMPVNLLQNLLGHASLATTTIYTSADEETLYSLLERDLSGESGVGNGLPTPYPGEGQRR